MKDCKIEVATETGVKQIVDLYKRERGRELRGEIIKSKIEEYPAVVIRKLDILVGFAFSSTFAPDILELMNIYVSEEVRGNNLGSKLIAEFETIAKEDYSSIILVNSRLYEKNGEKKSARTFYLKNDYKHIATTGDTNIFYKPLKKTNDDIF